MPRLTADLVDLAAVRPLREAYGREMACQIVHDALHARPGWTREYLLGVDGEPAGYGSVAVGGPWTGRATLYEAYVVPAHRSRLIDLAAAALDASGAVALEMQSNDPLGVVVLHAFARDVTVEKLLFRDGDAPPALPPPAGATFRAAAPADGLDVPPEQLPWHGVIEVDGAVAATGGALFHYNAPYADVYMEVAPAFRRRGLGSFLVQELARRCRAAGFRPAARCDPTNFASRRTLQRAGLVPCGHVLVGNLYANPSPAAAYEPAEKA